MAIVQPQENIVVTRLCALWALTEVSLGGVLHAMKIPLSGLVVGTTALACLFLIAQTSKSRLVVLRSLMVVATIKLIATPHASPFAYLAMSAQALSVLPLVGDRGKHIGWVLSMFVLASLYSPIQKLIILYVTIGGEGIMAVLEALFDWLNPPFTFSGFIGIPISIWMGVHVVFGLLAARWLHTWIHVSRMEESIHHEWRLSGMTASDLPDPPKRRNLSYVIACVALVGLVGLFVYGKSMPDWIQWTWRPLLVITVWLLVVKPAVQYLGARLVRRSTRQLAVEQVMSEMPKMWTILQFAMMKASRLPGWVGRLKMFMHVTVALAIVPTRGIDND